VRRLSRHTTSVLVAVIVALLAVGGCGKDDGADVRDAPTQAPTVSEPERGY
jgi:hypothetical protein